MSPRTVPAVTCLGCGCLCDDIVASVEDDLIVALEHACDLGLAWFGDGAGIDEVRLGGADAAIDTALALAARILVDARGRAMVYLAPDVSSEAQRHAIGIADRLGAVVDGATSAAALGGILAGQRRGRATATLGELRARADVVVFWACDPEQRYPRYRERYVPARAGRTFVGVSIGRARAPGDVDVSIVLDPTEEIPALGLLRAAALDTDLAAPLPGSPMAGLADTLLRARYAALVHDGEPGPEDHPARSEALTALAQALNVRTRGALSTLRAGGNRSGAEAVLTAQTGYPATVEFALGYPVFRPDRRWLDAKSAADTIEAVLLVGNPLLVPDEHRAALASRRLVIVGPHAADPSVQSEVAVQTGSAGIHEDGIAYRLDDIPLPLTPPVPGLRSAADTLAALSEAVIARKREISGAVA
jgi:formylmethanofuran dehydrogenase subunit B